MTMWAVRLILMSWAVAALLAQPSYSPGDIAEGGRLFRANCVACHGPEGTLVSGVDLGHGKFRRASTEAGIIQIIQNGIPGTAMPPNNFTDFQAGTIVAYLGFLATSGHTTSGNGDVGRGKTIFEGKGGCTNCHRVNGTGSRIGPDLSEMGALRRAVELEHSVLEPNDEVLPQNRFYRAITRDGETITGKLLNQDTFTVQILDSQEHLRSLQKSNLRDAAFVKDSPMPSFRDKLSSAELADLVAYLVSLKGF